MDPNPSGGESGHTYEEREVGGEEKDEGLCRLTSFPWRT